MKKFLAIIITSALLASALTACSGTENENGGTTTSATSASDTSDTSAESTENTSDNSDNTSDTASEDTSDGGENNDVPSDSDGETAKILSAIKEAYGENYLPSMPVEKEYLVSVMGLEEGSFTDFAGELPMISAHADMAIIVKAADGKAADVKEKLEAYRKYLIEDSMQYPMNMPKINASKVLENGDYLGYIILGAFSDEEADESAQADFAEEQVKIGVDAFNNYFA